MGDFFLAILSSFIFVIVAFFSTDFTLIMNLPFT